MSDEPSAGGADDTGAERTAPSATLRIETQQGLVDQRAEIVARLQANPLAARMLFLNPVMAFADAGIELTPAVANHVLHAIQYPPEVRAQRDQLEDQLYEALGRRARPCDPSWLADVVFGQLRIVPRDIGGTQPTYLPAIDAATVASVQSLMPTRGVVTVPGPSEPPTPTEPSPTAQPAPEAAGTTESLAAAQGTGPTATPLAPLGLSAFTLQTVQQLDLDAPVPALPLATSAPPELSLTDLWFYKDTDPTVRQLLQLGILMQSGVAIYSSSQYRSIRDGATTNQFLSWITAVHVPSGST